MVFCSTSARQSGPQMTARGALLLARLAQSRIAHRVPSQLTVPRRGNGSLALRGGAILPQSALAA